ncbi:transcriptional regulator [Oceanispirochaeta crateris]|jgi:DNA-binding HxlR family transcriptional regulator|uniref:Transcriptional regulator n=1 Tax=Oceanispirochaeta crateris TaxID=2518645 RepID=A0A5C1QQA4_9SPIO|nr:helix-turn-helix domain-containing protein [Oceanispirochaeta crateris]QEN08312.1 transcriptional regulator [Oceanispirochaeta crateris]
MSIDKYIEECKVCTVDEKIKATLCPVCLTQRVVRGKWKIVIVWLLREEAMRFSRIKQSIPHITQAYLSAQLKELESDRLIFRKSYDEVPPRVEYSLSPEGKSLVEVIRHTQEWGASYIKSQIDS